MSNLSKKLIIIYLLVILDILITMYGLDKAIYEEINPLVKYLLSYGNTACLIFKMIAEGILLLVIGYGQKSCRKLCEYGTNVLMLSMISVNIYHFILLDQAGKVMKI